MGLGRGDECVGVRLERGEASARFLVRVQWEERWGDCSSVFDTQPQRGNECMSDVNESGRSDCNCDADRSASAAAHAVARGDARCGGRNWQPWGRRGDGGLLLLLPPRVFPRPSSTVPPSPLFKCCRFDGVHWSESLSCDRMERARLTLAGWQLIAPLRLQIGPTDRIHSFSFVARTSESEAKREGREREGGRREEERRRDDDEQSSRGGETRGGCGADGCDSPRLRQRLLGGSTLRSAPSTRSCSPLLSRAISPAARNQKSKTPPAFDHGRDASAGTWLPPLTPPSAGHCHVVRSRFADRPTIHTLSTRTKSKFLPATHTTHLESIPKARLSPLNGLDGQRQQQRRRHAEAHLRSVR